MRLLEVELMANCPLVTINCDNPFDTAYKITEELLSQRGAERSVYYWWDGHCELMLEPPKETKPPKAKQTEKSKAKSKSKPAKTEPVPGLPTGKSDPPNNLDSIIKKLITLKETVLFVDLETLNGFHQGSSIRLILNHFGEHGSARRNKNMIVFLNKDSASKFHTAFAKITVEIAPMSKGDVEADVRSAIFHGVEESGYETNIDFVSSIHDSLKWRLPLYQLRMLVARHVIENGGEIVWDKFNKESVAILNRIGVTPETIVEPKLTPVTTEPKTESLPPVPPVPFN